MEWLMKLNPTERRRLFSIIAMGAISLLGVILFGVIPNSQAQVTYGFVLGDEWVLIHEWVLSAKHASLGFALIALVASVIGYFQFKAGKTIRAVSSVVGFTMIMSFMSWAAAGKFIPLTGLLQGALMLAVPLIFGSMAGVISERSGVVNIAIEGQLLAGAFAAGVVASLTQNTYWGLLAAPLAGCMISTLLAIFAVNFGIDQIILGFVLNVLVYGLTAFFYKRLLIPYQSTWNSGPILSPIKIPILSKLPVIGPILFEQTIIVYLMYAAIFILTYALFKTRWGLRTRAVGEHPTAADSVGINVNLLRFRNVMLAGAVAGLGGAYFTVGAVGSFNKEMTAGKGFIALAALIFGRWSPWGAVSAALLFGFADNLQTVLGIIGTPIPSPFMSMVPYVVTIIAVAGVVGRVRAPAADGVAYKRGESK
ncbi:MAG: ABC transporter permease [Actinobacteria bacterium]|nr:ABC transporter permease [Actinomycetota bacterium]MSW99250.1 ABC transporter permease [Actinomycetota bacterium]MSY82808.1 ABC transporter permease [Actinomycetota bacterium]MSZ45618.1 ABC transporter permease [Actinomycetota bacterium]MTA04930.1 ABC transporter permease [Actinomycetota bacterium]